MEEWKDIKGFEGMYQISDKGRLRSFKKMVQPLILSVKNSKGWYLSIILCRDRKRVTVRIHRLVAEAFVPNPEGKPEVNHKDGNKQNNDASNLEWVTDRENVIHAVKQVPSMLSGINHYNKFVRPKPVQQLSLSGNILAEFPTAKEAQRATGVCRRNILQVANKTEYKPGMMRKQAGGFVWRFKDEL
jgi:hypothetical protein